MKRLAARDRAALAVAALAIVALAACSDTTIAAADYDQRCDAVAECRTVPAGDVCACDCMYDAINARDELRYNADYAEKLDECSGSPLCGACPDLPAPLCEKGKCRVR
jgi:hypothetical protein